MPRSIHQLLAVFDEADAQGGMARLLQNTFQSWGLNSRIYAATIAPGQSGEVSPASDLDLPGDPAEILLYHYSINSPAGELFRRTFRSQVLVYHNITPAHFFRGYDPLTRLQCQQGQRELRRFIPTTDLALAVSAFNASELRATGFPRVEVLPFPLDENELAGPADPHLLEAFGQDDWVNLLFVGRLAPNKKQEEILKVFYFFQKYFNPKSRLFLVGAPHITAYAQALREAKEKLGLNQTYLPGKVSAEELRAYYRIADLFLCLSEHEGFGVPLLESIYYGIPIVAYEAAAIPETLGGGGILIKGKNPPAVAALIHRILTDPALKAQLEESQKQRLAQIQGFPFAEKLREYLQPLL